MAKQLLIYMINQLVAFNFTHPSSDEVLELQTLGLALNTRVFPNS